MKYTAACRKIIWIGLFIGVGGLLCPIYSAAFSGPTLDPDQLEYVEIDASVMIVNFEPSYVVIAEKRFDVSEFKIGDEIYKTELLNAAGNEIPLQTLKKGEYVIVKGIRLSDDKIIADRIQIKSSRDEGVKRHQTIPRARRLNPLW